MTGDKSLQTYKPGELTKLIKEQVATCSTPYELVRMEQFIIAGEDNKQAVAEMLLELNEFSNVSRKMNGSQVVETVRMMLQQYPNLSLQEYQAFFNRIRAGYYGQLYDSLDGIKIMAFIRQFYDEMNTAWIEKVHENDYRRKVDTGARDLKTWNK